MGSMSHYILQNCVLGKCNKLIRKLLIVNNTFVFMMTLSINKGSFILDLSNKDFLALNSVKDNISKGISRENKKS